MRAAELLRAALNAGAAANLGDFEQLSAFGKFASAVVAQNTKWANAKKALDALEAAGVRDLAALAALDAARLAELIKPSGFYNTKAKRLSDLARAAEAEFGDLDGFVQGATREWLIAQKGIGNESVDTLLLYVCGRAVMIVDAATLKLTAELGYEFDCYEEAAEWLKSGALELASELLAAADAGDGARFYSGGTGTRDGGVGDGSAGADAAGECDEEAAPRLFAAAHAVLLNFSKDHFAGKKPDETAAAIFAELRS